ncbi:hypothetical protein CR513_59697, partial [Mucuna pruriens]
MIVDELQNSLLVHEQRMNDHNSHEEQALKVAQDKASPNHGQGRNTRQQYSDITVMSSNIFRVNAQRSHKITKQNMLKVVKKQCYSWHNIQ